MASPFAKTTFGPPAPGTTDTDKLALIADVQNGVVEIVDASGFTHGMEVMQLLLQAQTALTAITTAQTWATDNLPAFALNKLNRTLRISGTAIFSTAAANTPTIAVALKLGATTLCTVTSAAVAASITNGQLGFEFIISVQATGAAAAAIEAHGELWAQLTATLTTALAFYADTNTAVIGSLNLTTAQALTITITGAGGTISSAQLRQLMVEVIN